MAENVLETRIQLRYGTYSQWMNSSVILKQGEAAVCAFPQDYTIDQLSNNRPNNTPPAIGIKIGDGYHYFSQLPWIQGIAADVYNWAKSSVKPTYNANEIQGLSTLIQEYINDIYSGDITIEAKLYRLKQGLEENSNKYYLQSKGANDDDWVTDELNYIDLSKLTEIVQWLGTAPDDYWTIQGFTTARINDKLANLNYTDNPQSGQIVTAVNQTNGVISVTHTPMYAGNLSGTVSVEHGGTGRSFLDYDSVLVGNGENAVILKPIDNILTSNTNLATNRAIITYIDNATAGITGAMHYVGEATVPIDNGHINPQISGYDFSKVQMGDVITSGAKEYVWSGYWRLLGDEGSYVVSGAIMNKDVSNEANIDQNKIANLITDLFSKVDKEEGKSLTSNDFTDEYKLKLDNIEDEAQRNVIEHIYVNGTEAIPTIIDGKENSLGLRISALTPEEEEKIGGIEPNAQVNRIEHIFVNEEELNITTIKNLTKSVNISLIEFTEAEKQKLSLIEPEAQVNTIEKIIINSSEFSPDENKAVQITLDQAALNLNVLEGARYPIGNNEYNDVLTTNKKLELAQIAATGNVAHLLQTRDTYIILDCGSSTEVI